MTNIHDNGDKPVRRNGLEPKPFCRNVLKYKVLFSNRLDYAMVSNHHRSAGIILTTEFTRKKMDSTTISTYVNTYIWQY